MGPTGQGFMIDEILRDAANSKASDVHIHAGMPPQLRIATTIQPASSPAIEAEMTARIAKVMMGEHRWSIFEQKRNLDFSYELSGVGRFRVNAHYQRGTVALAIRLIDTRVPRSPNCSCLKLSPSSRMFRAAWFWSPDRRAAEKARRSPR